MSATTIASTFASDSTTEARKPTMPEIEPARIDPESTHMYREAGEAAQALRAQYDSNHSRAL